MMEDTIKGGNRNSREKPGRIRTKCNPSSLTLGGDADSAHGLQTNCRY